LFKNDIFVHNLYYNVQKIRFLYNMIILVNKINDVKRFLFSHLTNIFHKTIIKFMMKILKISLNFFIFYIFLTIFTFRANAAVSLSFSNYLPIIDKNVSDGQIITATDKGNTLSRQEYDPKVIGVVSSTSAIVFNGEGETNTYPIVSTGRTAVKVSTINGAIKVGDFITTSKQPGIGMKATRTGYIIGTALESYNGKSIGKIQVSLNIRYVTLNVKLANNLLEILKISSLATYEEPLTVFKYFISALIVFASFFFVLFCLWQSRRQRN